MAITPPSDEPIETTASRSSGERELGGDPTLPVPSGPLHTRTPGDSAGPASFWRKIKMRAGMQERRAAADELHTRLRLLEQRLELTQDTIRTRLESLENRIDDVWEVEEQLSHLAEIQAKLDGLARGQGELRDAVGGGGERSTSSAWIFVVAAVGAALGVLAASLVSRLLG